MTSRRPRGIRRTVRARMRAIRQLPIELRRHIGGFVRRQRRSISRTMRMARARIGRPLPSRIRLRY